MAAFGSWVNGQITRSVLATSGAAGAAFMEGFMEPIIQDIEPDGTLSRESRDRLDSLLDNSSIRQSIVSVKLWRADGTVIYSSETKDLEGQQFVSTDVAQAASGTMKVEFADMISVESAHEQTLGLALIEVYAPLRSHSTGEIVAVGEVYENAETLALQLKASRSRTWVLAFVTTLLMLSVLYLIVWKGNKIIVQQRLELNRRMEDLQKISSQNEGLRLRAEETRMNANQANEEIISRVGQELHDGPIQILSLVMLRIGRMIRSAAGDKLMTQESTIIADLMGSVIQELRTLSTGLVLPEIIDLSAGDAIRQAVERHENLTGSEVRLSLDDLPGTVPPAIKICLYRITQESLSNAYRHAGGVGQEVEVFCDGSYIFLRISDGGTASSMSDRENSGTGTGLGMRSIRDRVFAFGGTVQFTGNDEGTTVSVSLPLT
ncbi:ATP-binding protein [Sedimentitalea sp.]|uniref:sensor histidine kinase n=1 Tax=Sedimentitalea sp. TaxID=2048915 RepID=UPI0032976519